MRHSPEAASAEEAAGSEIPGGRLSVWLFAIGLAVYAATRLAGLADFPIFFFTDEAIQANTAQSLVHRNFRDAQGVLLPGYFLNDQRRAMSLNIYLLAAPIALFGKTILTTRGTFAIVSLLGAAAAGGALRVLGSRGWWSPPLLLAAMPVDFLHSRVAFETTPACFAGFLFAYLLYRLRSPRWAFLAVLLGAATFYSYTAGQGIMIVMGVLLLVSDFRYHARVFREHNDLMVGAILLLAVTMIPLVREMRRHPHSTRDQLTVLNSYWVSSIPLSRKLGMFAARYVQAFRPSYWFFPGAPEAVRHLVKDRAFVPPPYLVLLMIGGMGALASARKSAGDRVLLFSPLAVPFSAAAGDMQILRVLPMIVPIALFTALGVGEVLSGIRRRLPRKAVAAAGAGALAIFAGSLARNALAEGPTWFHDYGLYGLQYGSRQIFEKVREALAKSPKTRVHVSPVWANNPLPFLDFFLAPSERRRVDIRSVDDYLLERHAVSDDELFVMTGEQYEKASSSRKLVLSPEDTIILPDGRQGFSLARLRYSEDADRLIAADREARRELVEGIAWIDGEKVTVHHSMLDLGYPSLMFDGRPETLVRGLEANPFVFVVDFPAPRRIAKVHLQLGAMDIVRLKVSLTPPGGGEPVSFENVYRGFRANPVIDFPLPDGAVEAREVRVELEEVGTGPTTHMHVYEAAFR